MTEQNTNKTHRFIPQAIKFLFHPGLGMDILLDFGFANCYPDDVFVCSPEKIEAAIPRLLTMGVEFEVWDRSITKRMINQRLKGDPLVTCFIRSPNTGT